MLVPRPEVSVITCGCTAEPVVVNVATRSCRFPGLGPSFESNAMRVPSGDQDGRHASKDPLVTWIGAPPVDEATYRWSKPSRSLRNEIHLPFGDACGPPRASPVMLQKV